MCRWVHSPLFILSGVFCFERCSIIAEEVVCYGWFLDSALASEKVCLKLSSIYSVCGGGCWAGTYNSQCTVFVFLLTKAFVFRRLVGGSYISIGVCLCASNCWNCCYHKMSGSVWQKVFNKLKISHLLFYETLLYSPANAVLVWCFDIMHEKMPGKHKNKISQYVKLKMHIESTIFSEKMYFLASKCLTEPLACVNLLCC